MACSITQNNPGASENIKSPKTKLRNLQYLRKKTAFSAVHWEKLPAHIVPSVTARGCLKNSNKTLTFPV